MPIELTRCDENPLCHGYRWSIPDENILAKMVSKLLLGQYRHVERILADQSSIEQPALGESVIESLLSKLSTPSSDASRYHRDGWVFQMISWVAARLSDPNALMAIPHSQEAQKGFDNLIVILNNDRTNIEAVIICEDKATESSRKTIRNQVWPEIADFETGRRDNELLNEVTPLLERAPAGINVDECITNMFWDENRSYRVSITTDKEDKAEHRRKLFRGYDVVVTGNNDRRRAETMYLDDLRLWMDSFCEKISEYLRAFDVR